MLSLLSSFLWLSDLSHWISLICPQISLCVCVWVFFWFFFNFSATSNQHCEKYSNQPLWHQQSCHSRSPWEQLFPHYLLLTCNMLHTSLPPRQWPIECLLEWAGLKVFLIKCSGSVLYVYNLCLDDQFRSEVKADEWFWMNIVRPDVMCYWCLGLVYFRDVCKKEELGLNYMDMNAYFK